MLSSQEINQLQGTRLNTSKAPWETYSEELEVKMTPELAADVADYATRYHDTSSNQNKEELARWQEQNYDAMGEYRWCSETEYADIEARIGRIMHSSELINRLRKIGVNCWYRAHPQADKITLLVQRGQGTVPPEVGAWVQNGYMPELTVMGFDPHGVPVAERYRGWRTVCLQLILKGIVTEEKVNKEFGQPRLTKAYDRYNMILHGWRNRGKEFEEVQ
jgi:hypothetical protein